MRRSRRQPRLVDPRSAGPESQPAFLRWLGGQSWGTWVKVTLFVLLARRRKALFMAVLVGVLSLLGGGVVAELVGGPR